MSVKPLSALRFTLTESAANTLTEKVLITGASAAARKVMKIYRIEVELSWGSIGNTAGQVRTATVCINTKQDETSIPRFNDPGTIYYRRQFVAHGDAGTTKATALTSMASGDDSVMVYDPPLLIADDRISVYLVGTGQDAALTVFGVIWFTIEDVTLEEALAILESWR